MLLDNRKHDVPFEKYDMQYKSLRTVASFGVGTDNGTALKLPGIGRFMFTQSSALHTTANGTPVIDGVIQESADGITWTTIAAFDSVNSLTSINKLFATTTQPFVRHVITITGNGSHYVAAGVFY